MTDLRDHPSVFPASDGTYHIRETIHITQSGTHINGHGATFRMCPGGSDGCVRCRPHDFEPSPVRDRQPVVA